MIDRRVEDAMDVAATFYDAAHGARNWPDALNALAQLFHGSRAWMFHSSSSGVIGHTSLPDPDFHSEEAQVAMVGDQLFDATHRQAEGAVVRHSSIMDLKAFYGRSLFQDWLRPRDVHFGLQSHLIADASRRLFVDISREGRQGDFEDRDLDLMRILAPHILRAGAISETLGSARRQPIADSLVATLVIDETMQVRDMNAAAARLLDASDRIGILGQRLRAVSSRQQQKLRDLVREATSQRGSGGLMIVGDALSDDDDQDRLIVSVAPLARSRMFGFDGTALAAVYLRPLAAPGDVALETALTGLFQLSPSLARLACTLARGRTLRQAALERGLTYSTARTYLDHIYRATGTGHQGQLVTLLKSIETALAP